MNRISLRLYVMAIMAVMTFSVMSAKKKYPEIKFEKTTIDLGTFSQDTPVQRCVFRFTNVGKAPLILNYVHPSCGCTGAEYPKDAISPGASGEIVITYDGTGKMPGNFSKYVQVFTNCKDDLVRIFIKGNMSALHPDALPKEEKKTEDKQN